MGEGRESWAAAEPSADTLGQCTLKKIYLFQIKGKLFSHGSNKLWDKGISTCFSFT